MVNFTEILEPIAAWFRSLGVPEPIVHWGHAVMMGIVIIVMGSFVWFSGWWGRLAEDKEVASKSRSDHRKLAPWMFLFMALGYTGGVLSLVMQHQPISQSPHFWTGSILLLLLGINGAISLSKFGGNKPGLRALHAYLGSSALCLMLIHALLGLHLGISL
jgi:fucose 4-O-acetylase-like acetyltransferase